MLTGSQLSVLQKAGRTEGGYVAQLNALHYATKLEVFSSLCHFYLPFLNKASVMDVLCPLESK